MQSSEVRNYGFNIIIKKYANFPLTLPLPCHMEHGWDPSDKPLKSNLLTQKPLMMVFNNRRKNAWSKLSNTPVVIMGSPFVHYKNTYKIRKKINAKGTIAFPSHSTFDVKCSYKIEDYCDVLKKLPKDFQPVTICLFWLDYISNKSKIYRQMGFKVTTAGPRFTNSLEFVKNFWEILSKHKYATSNDIGSYTFYAINLGVPFFLAGGQPLLINKNYRDINIKEYSSVADYKYGKQAIKLFSTGPIKSINSQQKEFTFRELGVNECLSAEDMHKILWEAYRKNHYWLKAFIPYLISCIMIIIIFNGPFVRQFILIRKRLIR